MERKNPWQKPIHLRRRIVESYEHNEGLIRVFHDRLKRWNITRKKKQFYDPIPKTPHVNALTPEYHQALSVVEADDVFLLDERGAVLNLTSD